MYDSDLQSFLSNFHLNFWALMFLLVLCFISSSIYSLLGKKGQMLHLKECSHFQLSVGL